MPNKIDLTGKIFGRLTVINESKNRTKDNRIKWICKCSCEEKNIVEIRSRELIRGTTKSCGCLRSEVLSKIKRIDLTGKIFDRLTVIKEASSRTDRKRVIWECRCNCEKQTIVNVVSDYLIQGHTKSCGCLKTELTLKRALDGVLSKNKTFDPNLTTARRIYEELYSDGDLSLDDFYQMSKLNCFYCGIIPSRTRNRFENSKNKETIEKAKFTYNGLDRVDPTIKEHTKENCVPCCWLCNQIKYNLNIFQFAEKINNMYNLIKNGFNFDIVIPDITIINKMMIEDNLKIYRDNNLITTTLGNRLIKRKELRYSDCNFDLEIFYYLCKQPCFYCLALSSNRITYRDNIFRCNGLDRIHNNGGHILNNVVPCCKSCNFGKGNDGILDFFKQIINIYNNMQNKDISNFVCNENILNEYKKRPALTEEHKAKISESLKGTIFTDERKANLSASQIGKEFSQDTRDKISKTLIEFNKNKK